MQTQEYVKISHPEISDAVLAQQTLAGDQQAFEVLVHRYSTPLFNFIYRFLGTSLPALSVSNPFKAWLFQVARNCCVDELRRRRRYAIHFSQLESMSTESETSMLADMPDQSPLPDLLAEHHDLQECLQRAIQTLPPKFRSVVQLRYAGQLSFAEIGQVLRMPEATAKTYFHRAKQLLRTTLRAQLQSAPVC